jgi:hypothetical protein
MQPKQGETVSHRQVVLSVAFTLFLGTLAVSQQPSTSGTFVLHKFAKPIGSETYSITASDGKVTLTSHFKFTDRGTEVPLETNFVADSSTMTPISYSAKGKASRQSAMDDAVTVSGNNLSITRSKKNETQTPSGPWFVTDGYSPVAMQEQMMRWWLRHGRPAKFTVYPSKSEVHIEPTDDVNAAGVRSHGYTVEGLIWGQESLWMDDSQNLIALVSTDAEFDHFEAIRQPYDASLPVFIASAVKAELAALAKLTSSSRMPPTAKLAIVGATLEDSTGVTPVKDSVILIERGKITAVGARGNISIPKGATILDATGKYAVPGLWDMHAHYEQVEWGPIYLAAGVTGVRDVGNEFDFIRTLHDQLDRTENAAIGPHMEFAGVIDGPGPISIGLTIAETPEQAVQWVEKYKSTGARQIKIYSSMKPEVVKAITAAAHARGMTVTGHIPEGMTAVEGVNDGMDQINHISYELPYLTRSVLQPDGKPDRSKPPILDLDGPRSKDLISTLQAHHVVLDPTVALYELFMHTKPLDLLQPGITHLPSQLREALDSPPPTGEQAAMADARWHAIIESLRRLHASGITIVAGTDQGIPGYSLHRELELYVEAGFTPLEALQSATIQSARAIGVEQESGSLEVGKRGDVLLLNADPLADIHNSQSVWRTVSQGAVYDPAPLWKSVGFVP